MRTTVTTSAPATTTSRPPLSREEAATRYLSIVEPYNIALEGLEQAVNAGESLESVHVWAEATASANVTHVRALQDTAWPPDVQPAVDELVAAFAGKPEITAKLMEIGRSCATA